MNLMANNTSKVRKKDGCGFMHTCGFRTLDKRWLLSFTSLPLGEIRVREQIAEKPFFRNLPDLEHWQNLRRCC